MNILHAFPLFPESYWSYRTAVDLVGKKAFLPPLGQLTLASLLPPDWNQRLVDLNVRDMTEEDLAWADYVFVGGMGVQWKSAQEIIARTKAAGKKSVGGGPLFTSGYALFQECDHFILNEAEITIKKFVMDVENGNPKRMYRTREYAEMAKSPVPMWSLLDLSKYALVGVQYSRGCPYDCDFCNVTAMLGRNPRIKKPEQIIAELDALYAAGWRDRVFFVDDNLIGNKRHLKEELLPALIEWQKTHGHLQFCTQVSINLADDVKMTKAMADAGFDTVFIGIETSDAAALEECQKKQNRNRNMIDDVKKLQRAGIEVQAGFIVGFDTDTGKTFQQQVDFIQASGIVTAMVGQLQAPPGTKLRTRMALEGRLRGMSLGDNTDGTTNIVPTMGVQELRKGHAWVLNTLYSPKIYYRRIKTLLSEYPNPTHKRPLKWEHLKAFARSWWWFGVAGAERFQYWGLLAWILMRKPKLLSHAVRLAAIGHHQRIMSEQIAAEVEAHPEAPAPGANMPTMMASSN